MELDTKTPRSEEPSPSPTQEEDENDDVFDLVDEQPLQEAAVTFIDDPYSSLVVFQSSSSYVTINGNEESCGSSFSDSGTSLMASVDTSGFRLKFAEPESEPAIPTFLEVLEHLRVPLVNSQI